MKISAMLVAIFALAIPLSVKCGQQPITTKSSMSGAASAVESDPVRDFEEILRRAESGVIHSDFTWHIQSKSTWIRKRYRLSGLTYDVKKTDSLVSPIIGVVRFKLHSENSTEFALKEQADAATDSDFRLFSTQHVVLNYQYRNSKWFLVGGENNIEMPSLPALAKGDKALGTLLNEKMPPSRLRPEDLERNRDKPNEMLPKFLP